MLELRHRADRCLLDQSAVNEHTSCCFLVLIADVARAFEYLRGRPAKDGFHSLASCSASAKPRRTGVAKGLPAVRLTRTLSNRGPCDLSGPAARLKLG